MLDAGLRRGERVEGSLDTPQAEDRLVGSLVALLSESFALWSVEAQAVASGDGTAILVEGAGRNLLVRRRPGDDLFGWEIEDRTDPSAIRAARPCTSVLGILSAVHRALAREAEPAARLRAGFMESAR